jgi:hypothetical protein
MIRAAITFRRVSMARQNDFSPKRLGAFYRSVKVLHLEPQKNAIASARIVYIADSSMVVFFLPSMQLQNELASDF